MDTPPDVPFDLPPGGYTQQLDGQPALGRDGMPVLWVARSAAPAGTWARARAAHTDTGWWPLLLSAPDHEEDGPSGWERVGPYLPGPEGIPPSTGDVESLLLRCWRHSTSVDPDDDITPEERLAVTAPYGNVWPGLAPAVPFDRDPDATADARAGELEGSPSARLGLVRAGSGLEALEVLGWSAPNNHGYETEDATAVLADWERRFGTRVLEISGATLVLSVASVPGDRERALRVAAEHFALCPDAVWQGTTVSDTLEGYAESLVGKDTWSFWWD
ncbi:DUF4253 domain-containing protein [Streptomyces sp. NPDC005438]|uniref:DUF4253 domain-containing protein n=1 Tax=Streptomyces sp. NPDC005438 TaxID=3156880 RepID=UPI0033AE1E4B